MTATIPGTAGTCYYFRCNHYANHQPGMLPTRQLLEQGCSFYTQRYPGCNAAAERIHKAESHSLLLPRFMVQLVQRDACLLSTTTIMSASTPSATTTSTAAQPPRRPPPSVPSAPGLPYYCWCCCCWLFLLGCCCCCC